MNADFQGSVELKTLILQVNVLPPIKQTRVERELWLVTRLTHHAQPTAFARHVTAIRPRVVDWSASTVISRWVILRFGKGFFHSSV